MVYYYHMKILFLTNNDITLPLYKWLREKEGDDNVFLSGDKLDAGLISGIDFIISYNYAHIIKQEVISLFPHRIINLHTSLLPWNKGASPNIWSFIEGTPGGVTIHEIDSGIDTGDILVQQEIVFDFETETLKSAYEKSHIIISTLFRDNWELIKQGAIKPLTQTEPGTVHYVKDAQIFQHIINYDDTIETFLDKYWSLLGDTIPAQ